MLEWMKSQLKKCITTLEGGREEWGEGVGRERRERLKERREWSGVEGDGRGVEGLCLSSPTHVYQFLWLLLFQNLHISALPRVWNSSLTPVEWWEERVRGYVQADVTTVENRGAHQVPCPSWTIKKLRVPQKIPADIYQAYWDLKAGVFRAACREGRLARLTEAELSSSCRKEGGPEGPP